MTGTPFHTLFTPAFTQTPVAYVKSRISVKERRKNPRNMKRFFIIGNIGIIGIIGIIGNTQ